ncbi:MAG TPA: hypothetical protein VK611_11235 [Acidimicrobiales bacterium]|nr:hypothetical protein [Acidimicrobiales bacterium]
MSEPRDDEFWQQSQDARRARLPRYAWICLAGLLVGGVLVAVAVLLLGNGSTDSARDEPRPAHGITLPGMPAGSPGMGDGGGPFEMLSIDDGALDTYTTA